MFIVGFFSHCIGDFDIGMKYIMFTCSTQEYKKFLPKTSSIKYKSDSTHTLDSRSEMPAWMFRDRDNQMERFESPWLNPQANIDVTFANNIQTRLQEKKQYIRYENDWNVWIPL